MNFQVNPDTVANYGGLVERNGLNLSLVNVHLAQNVKLGNTTGFWLNTLIAAHDETVSRMLDSNYKGFHAMGDSSGELKRTADYYRSTDLAQPPNWTAPTLRRDGRRWRRLRRVPRKKSPAPETAVPM